ncbi:hypothetical protein E2320_022496 [Naja naja]|nr:hypothetical protein E2320_022496 [Naja naja]
MGGYWQLVFACCLLVQSLSAEYSVKDNSTSAVKDNSTSAVISDEELKKNIGQRIASLQEMGQDEISNYTDLALQYYNMRESSLFTTLGDTTVTVKQLDCKFDIFKNQRSYGEAIVSHDCKPVKMIDKDILFENIKS